MQAAMTGRPAVPPAGKIGLDAMHYSGYRALLFFGAFSFLPMAAAHGFEAFISNEKDNTVSVVDLDKMAVVRTY